MSEDWTEALPQLRGLRILCSGNAVRSPFAELLLRHRGCPLAVDSAATTYRNDTLFEESARALRQRGVGDDAIAAFRSRHLDDILVREPLPPDWGVVGMTWQHLEDARPRLPRHRRLLLGELCGLDEIADPVMDDIPYDEAYATIERCLDVLLRALA